MNFFDMLLAKKMSGGGGSSAVLISKNITANGTYSAQDDEADGYSSVSVDVPNTYTQADDGKVVSNGALVAQGSDTVTENGTVDTTLISSLLVNVAGSGASALKLISDQNIVVNDCYIFEGEKYIYIFGYVQQEKSSTASLIIPQEFNINIIGAKVKNVWHSISSSTELNNFNSFTFNAELRNISFRSTSDPSASYNTKYMLIATFEKNSV